MNTSLTASPTTCGATTRSGTPCSRLPAKRKSRCHYHGGAPGSGAQPGNSNAFKHGFPDGRTGSIRITLTNLGDGFRELVIADDGVGFPEGFDPSMGKGLGMQIIRSLAGQLGGVVAFENGPGVTSGAKFRLKFNPDSETPVSP